MGIRTSGHLRCSLDSPALPSKVSSNTEKPVVHQCRCSVLFVWVRDDCCDVLRNLQSNHKRVPHCAHVTRCALHLQSGGYVRRAAHAKEPTVLGHKDMLAPLHRQHHFVGWCRSVQVGFPAAAIDFGVSSWWYSGRVQSAAEKRRPGCRVVVNATTGRHVMPSQ